MKKFKKAWNKLAVKKTSEGFGYVIEQDFNPDFVQLFGIDSFTSGVAFGASIVLAGSLIIFGEIKLYKLLKTK